MQSIIYIALGGGLGAVARHLVSEASKRFAGTGFPYGTMTVNILGSLLMGLLMGWLITKQTGETLKLFLATGFLGGFTTFSAFSLDAINLLERKAYTPFFLYVMGSVIIAIIALAIGLVMARRIWT